MQPIPQPAPYLGLNQNVIVADLQTPACEQLLNFNSAPGGLELRKGDVKFSSFDPADFTALPLGMFNYGDTRCFALVKVGGNFIKVYDVETSALLYTTINSVNTLVISSFYFNNYQFFFPDTATLMPGFVYDGAAFGVTGYTGTNFFPIGGNTFKRRAYMAQLNEAAYWYSGIDKISGACTKVDLSSIVTNKCTLSSIGSFTLSDQVTTVVYQAFIFNNGEVLFYTGSYPDSSDWGLAGRAKIGQPTATSSVVPLQGDTLLICDTGVVSLRDLFLKGSQKGSILALTDKISDSWSFLIQGMRKALTAPVGPVLAGLATGKITGIYDSKTNRLIFSFPYYLSNPNTYSGAGSFYFVYDTILAAWSFHRSFGGTIYDIVFYKNKILTYSNAAGISTVFLVYEKEGSTGYTDRNARDTADVGFDYTIQSAPINNGRSDSAQSSYQGVQLPPGYVQQVCGMDFIMKSDLYAQTSFQLIKDLGVQTSSAQVLTGVVSGTLQKPFVNMGIEGTYLQYKISGTTVTGKTTGLTLYGTNTWIQQGQSPR